MWTLWIKSPRLASAMPRGAQCGRQATAPTRWRLFICIPLGLGLVACPAPSSFVEHYAELNTAPDLRCILHRLRAIAVNDAVEVIDDQIPLGVNHRFVFQIGGVPHHLGVLIRPDNSASLRHTAWAPHLLVAELQAAQRSLSAVEKSLVNRCDTGDFIAIVQESCYGENCDQLRVPPDDAIDQTRER